MLDEFRRGRYTHFNVGPNGQQVIRSGRCWPVA